MTCKDCKAEMHQLFDDQSESKIQQEIKHHLAGCDDCTAAFDEMKSVFSFLQPAETVNAPLLLKQQILDHLIKEEKKMKNDKFRLINLPVSFKRIVSIAAVVATILLIMPFIGKNGSSSEAKAAVSFLEKSILATDQIHSMIIHFSVRTDTHDNFALIGKDYPMVAHTITKSFDTPAKWKVEKSGRTILNDGTAQYLWMPEVKNAIKTGIGSGMAEWFHILLDPRNILSMEEEAAKAKNSRISEKEAGGKTYLIITSRAEGNFLNDYLLNKSIDASDNRREYVFDSKTKLLEGLKIYLLDKTKERLIFDLDHIEYNTVINPATFTIPLPEGIEWSVLDLNVTNANLSNISSKKAAELALEGLAKKDFDTNKELWSQYSFIMLKLIASQYGDLQVIQIGEPFKSWIYPGEFVPYEIKQKDGSIRKWNLALRNDNPHKVWMIDGGL